MRHLELIKRPLAFTDIETTGTDPLVHEIIEIGLVVVDQQSLQAVGEFETKIKPEHIELAQAKALEVNGYRPEDWQDACALKQAMAMYSVMAKDAIFVAYNAFFDWPFVHEAFRRSALTDPLDCHHLCAMSMGWFRMRPTGLVGGLSLKNLAKRLGVPEEPLPHRAINGARTVYEVFKRLTEMP